VSDGVGGAIIAWDEQIGSDFGLYAQRLSASGTPQWGPSQVPIVMSPAVEAFVQITSNGSGGAIFVWHQGGTNPIQGGDIYAQGISAGGLR
jgi:hypothetical protein